MKTRGQVLPAMAAALLLTVLIGPPPVRADIDQHGTPTAISHGSAQPGSTVNIRLTVADEGFPQDVRAEGGRISILYQGKKLGVAHLKRVGRDAYDARFVLPLALTVGRHRLTLIVDGPDGNRRAKTTLTSTGGVGAPNSLPEVPYAGLLPVLLLALGIPAVGWARRRSSRSGR